jgi:hypothetical protein
MIGSPSFSLRTATDLHRPNKSESLRPCDEVLVIDHGALHETCKVARLFGARVLTARTETFEARPFPRGRITRLDLPHAPIEFLSVGLGHRSWDGTLPPTPRLLSKSILEEGFRRDETRLNIRARGLGRVETIDEIETYPLAWPPTTNDTPVECCFRSSKGTIAKRHNSQYRARNPTCAGHAVAYTNAGARHATWSGYFNGSLFSWLWV